MTSSLFFLGTFRPILNPKIKIQRIQNLLWVFGGLKEDGVQLVGIASEDIEGANLKLILGLIWTLILHYQIHPLALKGKSSSR